MFRRLVLFTLLAVSHGMVYKIEALEAWTLCCKEKPLYGEDDPTRRLGPEGSDPRQRPHSIAPSGEDPSIHVVNPPQGNDTEISVWVPSISKICTIVTNQTTCAKSQYRISVYMIRWPFWQDCCFATENEAVDLAKNIDSAYSMRHGCFSY